MTRVKICGLTRAEDVSLAVALGAWAVGFVLVPTSRRWVSPEQVGALARAAEGKALRVGVVADLPLEEAAALGGGLDALQLHGHEDPDYVRSLRRRLPGGARLFKALRLDSPADRAGVEAYAVDALLLDSGGGTGRPFDWSLAEGWTPPVPVMVAGGLDPTNVGEAIARLKPFAVDVAGGVEVAPGRKDPGRMADFFTAVKASHRLILE